MSYSSGTKALIGEAASWVVAAGLCVAAFIYFEDLRSATTGMIVPGQSQNGATSEARTGGQVEIRAGESGHYHTEAELNGRSVQVLVDTGATMLALTYEDARTAGIYLKPSDFTLTVGTANGTARVAPVTIDRVSIGDITVRNVAASVSEPGRLQTTLLGMSFLRRLSRVDMRAGVLLLED